MAKPNFIILGKIARKEISITNRHKETIDKLVSLGYIISNDGEWTLTSEGEEALREYENE